MWEPRPVLCVECRYLLFFPRGVVFLCFFLFFFFFKCWSLPGELLAALAGFVFVSSFFGICRSSILWFFFCFFACLHACARQIIVLFAGLFTTSGSTVTIGASHTVGILVTSLYACIWMSQFNWNSLFRRFFMSKICDQTSVEFSAGKNFFVSMRPWRLYFLHA